MRYLYSNLGTAKTSKQATINFPGGETPVVLVQPVSATLRTQSVLLGLSYSFS